MRDHDELDCRLTVGQLRTVRELVATRLVAGQQVTRAMIDLDAAAARALERHDTAMALATPPRPGPPGPR